MRIFSFFFTFFLCTNVFSTSDNIIADFFESVPHESNLSRSQLAKIQDELKIQSLILQSLERVRIQGGSFVSTESAAIKTTNAIIEAGLIKYSISNEVQKTKLREILNTPVNRKTVQSMLERISNLTKRMGAWQLQEFNSAYRTKGLFYALVKFASIQLDTTVPAALMLTGNVAIGAGMLVTPISPQTLLPFKLYKDAILNYKLIRELGIDEAGEKSFFRGLEKFKVYRNIKKMSAYNLFGQIDYMNTRFSYGGETLIIQQENFINRYILRKGYNQALNYTNLVEFLSEFDDYSNYLRKLETSTLSKQLKVYSLLAILENTASEDITQKFLARFEQSIVSNLQTEISHNHVNWIRKIAKAKSLDKFFSILIKMPEDIHPATLEQVWREYIILKLADNMEGGISRKTAIAFESMVNKSLTQMRAALIDSADSVVGYTNKQLFIDEIFKSLEKVNPCQFIYSRGLL